MPIYDRPVYRLMHDFASDRLEPNSLFSKQDAIKWFETHYPKIRRNTVTAHVEGMATNNGSHRKHHPTIRPGRDEWNLFFKEGRNRFRLWNKDTDPAPEYGDTAEAAGPEVITAESDDSGDRAFAYERDLQNYLAKNLALLEQGLKLYQDDDEQYDGIEFPAGNRYIDILAIGADGAFVVIELKVSRGHDRTVGQLLRYMAWVRDNLSNGTPVRGMIVANEISEDLKLASSMVSGIQLVEYEISFSLKQVGD